MLQRAPRHALRIRPRCDDSPHPLPPLFASCAPPQQWGEKDDDNFDGDDEDEILNARMHEILGADNLSCWGLIDQVIFMESHQDLLHG